MRQRTFAAVLICTSLLASTALAQAASPTLERDARIVSVAAIYFAPRPAADPQAAARQLLKTRKFFSERKDRKPGTDGATVFHEYVDLKQAHFEPPDLEQLHYFGHGLSAEQAQALQKSTHGLILSFNYGGPQSLEAVREMSLLMADLAQATGGLIWDEDTRELFGVDAWKKRRLGNWLDGTPMVEDFTSIHSYKNTDYIRAISLGMGKFGFPDVVINDFSWSTNRQMGNTINALSQVMVEGARVPSSGPFDLRIQSIRHRQLREDMVKSFLDKATGTGMLVLREAARDDGDPDNRLIEITFDRYSGKTVQERQDQFAAQIFGSHDELTRTRHTAEVLAASRRAKAKFETFRNRFEKGLAPGEHLMVKAPFKASDGGDEWMWVEVIQWKGADITGLLANDPELVPGLHAGATVKVRQAEIFDYIRYTADGVEEGNETGPLLEQAAE